MIEQDTVRLLRDCDAGVKMGVRSIDDVIEHVRSDAMREKLNRCKEEHMELELRIRSALDRFGDRGKSPNPVATTMSWIKTGVKLAAEDSDRTVADLMTDGCNMGVKSLNGYLNEFKAADEESKDIAKKLIALEERLAEDVSDYL